MAARYITVCVARNPEVVEQYKCMMTLSLISCVRRLDVCLISSIKNHFRDSG